ncbi:MAG: peptidylprolyl isomerase [Pseudomonadota bacterium]
MANPTMTIELKEGAVEIEMLADVAPKHVERITALASEGAYDGIAFHRVIDGFMAQTGDVEHGKVDGDGACSPRAGTGGSEHGNLPQEFSKLPFDRGVCGMARAQDPNSANSQFFIMFDEGHFLNGQYTVWGRVTSGMEHVDKIKRGAGGNGSVSEPDQMVKVTVAEG